MWQIMRIGVSIPPGRKHRVKTFMPYMTRQYMSAEKFLTTQAATNIVNGDDQARVKTPVLR